MQSMAATSERTIFRRTGVAASLRTWGPMAAATVALAAISLLVGGGEVGPGQMLAYFLGHPTE